MWRLVHQWSFLLFWLSFNSFWLFLTIGTLLVYCWYTLGRYVTIGTPMDIFAVLTVFWLFLIVFDDLVHCWYSLGRPVTIGTPMVKNSQKTVKTAKMTTDVPIVTCLPRLYQQCTNRQKQTAKNDHWCADRHMSTQSPPNTQSLRPPSASAEYTKPHNRCHCWRRLYNSSLRCDLSQTLQCD